MKPSNIYATSLLIILNLLTVTIVNSNRIELRKGQISNFTTGDVTVSTLEQNTFPESSTISETTSMLPETDSNNITGFELILYVFAIIGLTSSMICLIQLIRSSSFCDRHNDENFSMSGRERSSRSWRRSWRRNNSSKNCEISDHIIAV